MPPTLTYDGLDYPLSDASAADTAPLTVLDALLRAGVNAPFSCRKGICHTCMMRCTKGHIPPESQRGLSDSLASQGHFLPCHCVPTGDMTIAPPDAAARLTRAVLQGKQALAPDVTSLTLEPFNTMTWRAGQHLTLRRPSDGLSRTYSIASLCDEDYFITLHIKRDPNGALSRWLCDDLAVGDEVELQGPNGACSYQAHDLDQPLLLIATGTGLGPLWGITRDALRLGHRGPIYLYHGARHPHGLYAHAPLRALADQHPNLHYVGCVSGPDLTPSAAAATAAPDAVAGRAHEVARAAHPDLAGWQVYLCGLPAMVFAARVWTILAGARREDTIADPFTSVHTLPPPDDMAIAKALPPDLALWDALQRGPGLLQILQDFYPRVYADPQLSPFFAHVTMQRVIEKQFEFTREALTGSLDYFGMRPFNAHHWMVISDALFDHREALFESCLRRYGLPEHLVRRWVALDEVYRHSIVKPQPRGLWMGGQERPAEGFEAITIDVGSMCDGCQRELPPNTQARYHLRTGALYCGQCLNPSP
jgi:ferredoxin-NADP reductase/ferredoxin/truncated hemoglobin YjbI